MRLAWRRVALLTAAVLSPCIFACSSDDADDGTADATVAPAADAGATAADGGQRADTGLGVQDAGQPDASPADAGAPDPCDADPETVRFSRDFSDRALEAGDCEESGFVDRYRFSVDERALVAITAPNDNFTAQIRVFDEAGGLVDEAVDFLAVRLDPGTFRLEITGGAGDYRLKVELRESDCEPDGEIGLDAVINAELALTDCNADRTFDLGGLNARADVFRFHVSTPGYHRFDLTALGADGDLALAVYDEGGAQLAVSGDAVGTDPEIALRLEAGSYRVVAGSEGLYQGRYLLSYTRAAAPACNEHQNVTRRDPPFALNGDALWSCGNGIREVAVFVTEPGRHSVLLNANRLLTVDYRRNQGGASAAIAQCVAGPTCSFNADFTAGINWLRVSGGDPGDAFDLAVN